MLITTTTTTTTTTTADFDVEVVVVVVSSIDDQTQAATSCSSERCGPGSEATEEGPARRR